MDIYAQIARSLRALTRNVTGPVLFTAEVKSVEGETCTVISGDLAIPEVLLTPADEGAEGKLVITPKVGSMVTVADLSGGRLRRLAVVHWGEVEKINMTVGNIELNGGENGGLVNIESLKNNLESLKSYVEALKSAVSSGLNGVGTGSAASGSAGASLFNSRMASQRINFKDMEDTTITH